GAGRVVYQEVVRGNKALEEGELADNPVLNDAFKYAIDNKKKVHFIGLVSDRGVHSHINHLKGLCQIAAQKGIEDLYIHAFTDGRDTHPNSGYRFLNDLLTTLGQSTGKTA